MARMLVQNFDVNVLPPKLRRPTIRKMLEAKANVYSDEWKNSIKQHNHVRKKNGGDMLNSVGSTPVIETLDGGKCEVYPQGVDRHGVRNATKAYVLNYGRGTSGTKGYIRGDHFIKQAERNADQRAADAVQEVLNNAKRSN